jgi:hypothetical protein
MKPFLLGFSSKIGRFSLEEGGVTRAVMLYHYYCLYLCVDILYRSKAQANLNTLAGDSESAQKKCTAIVKLLSNLNVF